MLVEEQGLVPRTGLGSQALPQQHLHRHCWRQTTGLDGPLLWPSRAKASQIPTKKILFKERLHKRFMRPPRSSLPAQARSVYSGTQFPAPTQLLDRMHITIHLLLSTFTYLKWFSFGYLRFFKLQWRFKKKKDFTWFERKKDVLLANREKHCKNAQNCLCSHSTCSHTQNFSNYQITTWPRSEPLTAWEGSDSDWNS